MKVHAQISPCNGVDAFRAEVTISFEQPIPLKHPTTFKGQDGVVITMVGSSLFKSTQEFTGELSDSQKHLMLLSTLKEAIAQVEESCIF